MVKNLPLGFLCGIQKADESEMTPFNVKNQIRIRRSRWKRFGDKRQWSPCSGEAHVSPSGSSVFATTASFPLCEPASSLWWYHRSLVENLIQFFLGFFSSVLTRDQTF